MIDGILIRVSNTSDATTRIRPSPIMLSA